MSEFSKRPTEGVNNPNYSFFTIYENGKSPYDEFCRSLTQKKDKQSMESIHAIMDRFGPQLERSTFVNHIRGGKEDRNDVYEFKKGNIRVYFILQKPDVLILLGGYKNSQDSDTAYIFRHFNNLPKNIPDYEPQ